LQVTEVIADYTYQNVVVHYETQWLLELLLPCCQVFSELGTFDR